MAGDPDWQDGSGWPEHPDRRDSPDWPEHPDWPDSPDWPERPDWPDSSEEPRPRWPRRRLGVLCGALLIPVVLVGIYLARAAGAPPADPSHAGQAAANIVQAAGPASALAIASTPASTPSPAAPAKRPRPRPSPTPTPTPTPTPAPSTPPAASPQTAAADQVLALINTARSQAGLPALTISSGLDQSSAAHNARMQGGCGLSHQCPGEPSLGARETAAGVRWTSAGENIGDGGPVSGTSAAIAQMAVNLTQDMLNEKPPDDGHRRNILSSSFHHIGITVTRDSNGTVWMTQDFSN